MDILLIFSLREKSFFSKIEYRRKNVIADENPLFAEAEALVVGNNVTAFYKWRKSHAVLFAGVAAKSCTILVKAKTTTQPHSKHNILGLALVLVNGYSLAVKIVASEIARHISVAGKSLATEI